MQTRHLGATGLQVSRLGLGTWLWGEDTDVHEARDQLQMFVEAGGTLVDTAASYGPSEQVLGALLDDVVGREQVVLATKAGVVDDRSTRLFDTSRGQLLRQLDTSLLALRTDHVDLWQVHIWSDATPWEETLEALNHAVSSGRTRYVGVSNYTGWQTSMMQTWQRSLHGTAIASNQVEYSLLNREAEYEVVPAARAVGMGILPYSPLGGGVLTGKYRTGTPSDSRAASSHLGPRIEGYLDPRARRIVEAVTRAAEGLELTPTEVALAWVRDRPGVTAPIVGARTAAQLRGSLTVEEVELPAEITAALNDVSDPDTDPLPR